MKSFAVGSLVLLAAGCAPDALARLTDAHVSVTQRGGEEDPFVIGAFAKYASGGGCPSFAGVRATLGGVELPQTQAGREETTRDAEGRETKYCIEAQWSAAGLATELLDTAKEVVLTDGTTTWRVATAVPPCAHRTLVLQTPADGRVAVGDLVTLRKEPAGAGPRLDGVKYGDGAFGFAVETETDDAVTFRVPELHPAPATVHVFTNADAEPMTVAACEGPAECVVACNRGQWRADVVLTLVE